MKVTELDSSDMDAVFNQFAVARARSERLVRSWLPPPSKSDSQKFVNAQTGGDDVDPALEKLDARAAEDWMDTVGIGYRPAGDSLEQFAVGPQRSLLSNDRLRSLLLGTEQGKGKSRGVTKQRPPQITARPEGVEGPLPQRNGRHQNPYGSHNSSTKRMAKDSESDEELGRSAIGKKKKLGG